MIYPYITRYDIVPWLCASDVCFIIFCHLLHIHFVFNIIVQFMMSANSRIRFGLQIVFVCLYITTSHYHHCAKLSEYIELIKWVRLSIFSQLSIIQIMELCVFSLPISLVMSERIYTLSYHHHHHQIESRNYYQSFRVRSWKSGIRCVSLYILIHWLQWWTLSNNEIYCVKTHTFHYHIFVGIYTGNKHVMIFDWSPFIITTYYHTPFPTCLYERINDGVVYVLRRNCVTGDATLWQLWYWRGHHIEQQMIWCSGASNQRDIWYIIIRCPKHVRLCVWS